MGRVSKEQAQENRRRVVATASRMFREQGTGVSVADLMQAAGLTHGGFYKQFDSKEALVGEATAHAFAELAAHRGAELEGSGGSRGAARRSLTDAYLSARHRDAPASGCPAAALAADMARDPGEAAAHEAYAEGVRDFARWLETDTGEGADGGGEGGEGGDGMARLCTMVGALVLARATKGTALSDEILRAARAALPDAG